VIRRVLGRLGAAMATLLAVVTLSFLMMRLAPGDPFQGGRAVSAEVEQQLRAEYGLDAPLWRQYLAYLGGVAHGDFGPSLKYRDKQVSDIIAQGFPNSALLGGLALAVGMTAGIGLGVAGGVRAGSGTDRTLGLLAVLGVCLPGFVTAPLLVLVFASWLGIAPTGGWGGADHLVLPVLVLAIPQAAVISRLTRAGLIETLAQPYVRTARARGLPEHQVVLRHALPGALAPVLAYLGPAAAGLLTGSLVVEHIFGLPGLGRAFVSGALARDYTLVGGVVILYAALMMALNLLADLAAAWLDPRLRS
jgi:oligopeptide transport system permease protein